MKTPKSFSPTDSKTEGLEIIFSKNYFTFDGEIYLQKDGMAMGTNVAVSVADLCLGYLEIQANILPPKWFRYIDDGLSIQKKEKTSKNSPKFLLSENQVKMIEILNSLDPKIFWTTEPIRKTCEFLDLAINQKTGQIATFHKINSRIQKLCPLVILLFVPNKGEFML